MLLKASPLIKEKTFLDEHGDLITEVVGNEKEHSSKRAVLNMLVWGRIISFLRFVKSTRIFIFMLFEVIIDLKGFMKVLVFFLVAFATTHTILDLEGEHNIFETIA